MLGLSVCTASNLKRIKSLYFVWGLKSPFSTSCISKAFILSIPTLRSVQVAPGSPVPILDSLVKFLLDPTTLDLTCLDQLRFPLYLASAVFADVFCWKVVLVDLGLYTSFSWNLKPV